MKIIERKQKKKKERKKEREDRKKERQKKDETYLETKRKYSPPRVAHYVFLYSIYENKFL